MLHIVSLSGGKDSTAMLLMMLERKMPVDYILFCDTGVEFPEMYEHLQKVDDYIGEKYGKHITYLKADKDYQYYFSERVITKGERKGTKGYGYASTRNRWCTDRLKVKPQEKFTKALKQPYILYCGIAADEPERVKPYKYKRYPLAEWGVTEAQCLDYCKALGFTWGGLYDKFNRTGCYLCPLQSKNDWRVLYKNYPELFKHAMEIEAGKQGTDLMNRCRLTDYKAQFEFETKTGKSYKRYPRDPDKIKKFQDKEIALLKKEKQCPKEQK